MPQFSNLVVNDRETTPVSHTYTPNGVEGNSAALVETTGTPVGDRQFVINWSKTANNRYKRRLRLTVPIVQTQTVNGVATPVVVRTGYVDCTFTFDGTSTEQERKNVVGMFANSLDPAKTVINDTIVKLEGIY